MHICMKRKHSNYNKLIDNSLTAECRTMKNSQIDIWLWENLPVWTVMVTYRCSLQAETRDSSSHQNVHAWSSIVKCKANIINLIFPLFSSLALPLSSSGPRMTVTLCTSALHVFLIVDCDCYYWRTVIWTKDDNDDNNNVDDDNNCDNDNNSTNDNNNMIIIVTVTIVMIIIFMQMQKIMQDYQLFFDCC